MPTTEDNGSIFFCESAWFYDIQGTLDKGKVKFILFGMGEFECVFEVLATIMLIVVLIVSVFISVVGPRFWAGKFFCRACSDASLLKKFDCGVPFLKDNKVLEIFDTFS